MLSSFSFNGHNLLDLLTSAVIFLIIIGIIAIIYFHDRRKLSKKFSKNTYNFVPPNNTNIGTLNTLSQQESSSETQKVYCKNCGQVLDPRSLFCENCGFKIEIKH